MNNTKTIENSGQPGGDYFILIHSTRSNLYLKDFVDKFNFNDYWCYKTTAKQRLVTEAEFLEFKHAGYTFFKKDLYDKEHTQLWIDWIKTTISGRMQYMAKPVPPFHPSFIKVIERIDE
jgi:hypothetical protein